MNSSAVRIHPVFVHSGYTASAASAANTAKATNRNVGAKRPSASADASADPRLGNRLGAGFGSKKGKQCPADAARAQAERDQAERDQADEKGMSHSMGLRPATPLSDLLSPQRRARYAASDFNEAQNKLDQTNFLSPGFRFPRRGNGGSKPVDPRAYVVAAESGPGGHISRSMEGGQSYLRTVSFDGSKQSLDFDFSKLKVLARGARATATNGTSMAKELPGFLDTSKQGHAASLVQLHAAHIAAELFCMPKHEAQTIFTSMHFNCVMMRGIEDEIYQSLTLDEALVDGFDLRVNVELIDPESREGRALICESITKAVQNHNANGRFGKDYSESDLRARLQGRVDAFLANYRALPHDKQSRLWIPQNVSYEFNGKTYDTGSDYSFVFHYHLFKGGEKYEELTPERSRDVDLTGFAASANTSAKFGGAPPPQLVLDSVPITVNA